MVVLMEMANVIQKEEEHGTDCKVSSTCIIQQDRCGVRKLSLFLQLNGGMCMVWSG